MNKNGRPKSGHARMVRRGITLPPELDAALAIAAAQRRLTVSALVRQAVRLELVKAVGHDG